MKNNQILDPSVLIEKDKLFEKNKNLENEINTLKEFIEEQKESINRSDRLEISQKNEEILKLQNEMVILKNSLDKSKELSNKIKLKDLEIQNLKNQNNDLLKSSKDGKLDEKILNDYKELSSLHKQLKNQFDEKQNILNETRKELFFIKEKLTSIQREQNLDHCDLSEEEKIILKDFENSEKELENYVQENFLLENVINVLIDKKDVKKPLRKPQEIETKIDQDQKTEEPKQTEQDF